MERWLSLTVSPAKKAGPPSCFISIPKKIVRQAVRRNRIRRVLREALRFRGALPQDRTHIFKVVKAPKGVGLAMAQRAVCDLLD